MRILVVEDDELLAAALNRGLAAEGYAVEVAANGIDGLHRAREFDYDAMILDLLLPGLNGLRVCAELRGAGRNLPVLILTAKDGAVDHAEGLDTGADDYMAKPFTFPVLLAHLRALLRRGRPGCRRCCGTDRSLSIRPGTGVPGTARNSTSPHANSPYSAICWRIGR